MYTHAGHYASRVEALARARARQKSEAKEPERAQSPTTLDPLSLSNEPPQVLSTQVTIQEEEKRVHSQSSLSRESANSH